MPDFLRWIIAGISSVAVAVLVFLLATVGIAVAFVVFLVLFVVVGLMMRRMKKTVHTSADGSSFIFYTNIPGAGQNPPAQDAQHGVYELSPDDYRVEAASGGNPGSDTEPKAIGPEKHQ